jgi:hypothetical protein
VDKWIPGVRLAAHPGMSKIRTIEATTASGNVPGKPDMTLQTIRTE